MSRRKTYAPPGPFTEKFRLLTPTYKNENGVTKIYYTEDEFTFMANFRTFGGTKIEKNGILYIEDTAVVSTWFTSIIKADCKIKHESSGKVYEILGTPENINMRNQYLQFNVRRVGGQ